VSHRKVMVRILGWVLVALGVFGGVLFFPVQLGDDYTCLYHRMVYEHHPGTHHYQTGKTTVPALGPSQQDTPAEHQMATEVQMDQHSEPLKFYLRKFAPFWWASLFILFVGYIVFTRGIGNRKRRNRTPRQPGQTAKI